MKKWNIGTGIVFLAISVFGYIQTFGMIPKMLNDNLGPSFWPQKLCIAMGIMSVLLILSALFDKNQSTEPILKVKTPEFKRVMQLCVLLVCFGFLIYWAGIFIAMVIMMPICMLIHGERKPLVIALVTIGMAAFVYVIFKMALHVPLPMGMLFE